MAGANLFLFNSLSGQGTIAPISPLFYSQSELWTLHKKKYSEQWSLRDMNPILETKIYSELVRDPIVKLHGVVKASFHIVITYRNCFSSLPQANHQPSSSLSKPILSRLPPTNTNGGCSTVFYTSSAIEGYVGAASEVDFCRSTAHRHVNR